MNEPIFNKEAEENVISVILNEGESAYLEAAAILESDDFYQFKTQIPWEAAGRLVKVGKKIDPYTMRTEIGKEFDKIGGLPYLIELAGKTAFINNLTLYATDIKSATISRKKINQCETVIKQLKNGADPKEIIAKSLQDDAALIGSGVKLRIERAGDGMMAVLEEILESKKSDGITGLATGYPDLDIIGGGLQVGMTIIAARPSVGKTTFALNIGYNIAVHQKKTVLIFSLEMTKNQLRRKLIALGAEINSQLFNTASQISPAFERRLITAASILSEANLFIDDTSGLKASDIMLRSKWFKAAYSKLDLIIIDYLGMLLPESNLGNTNEKLSLTSKIVKNISKELEIPVIAIHQLNRGVESREDKTPGLADLRDSGALEQDADVVIFLHREDYYQKESTTTDPSETFVLVKKNRLEGGIGAAKLLYFKGKQKFESILNR